MHTSDGPTPEENGAPHPLPDGAEPEPGSDDRNGSHPAPAASSQATAAERFAARHYDDVFHYCLRHVGSKEDAQDLTQEVFLRIVRANADYDDRGKPLAYLYTVARHACADFHRARRAAWVELEEGVPDPAADRAVDEVGLADLIARLDEAEREVIALRYDQGLGVSEIAQALGTSRFAVHRTAKRALAKLERMMQG